MSVNYNYQTIRANQRRALMDSIDRSQKTIARLKSMSHRTVDAEHHLQNLVDELAALDVRIALVRREKRIGGLPD